jgi:anti-sigma B factor antagonist
VREFRCRGEWVGERSAVVMIDGELDMATSPELRDVLADLALHGVARHLVIDLSGCTFVDSTGLGLLVAVQRSAEAPLDLVVTDPQIVRLLAITALDRLFRVHATRAAALDSLRGRIGDLCTVEGEPIRTGEICG